MPQAQACIDEIMNEAKEYNRWVELGKTWKLPFSSHLPPGCTWPASTETSPRKTSGPSSLPSEPSKNATCQSMHQSLKTSTRV